MGFEMTGTCVRKPIDSKAPQRGRPEMPAAQREQMKRRISDAAKALFQEEGYAKISLRRIAKEIGCTPMTLYGYYPAKIDILRTLWDDVFRELFDHLESLPHEAGPQLYLGRLCAAYAEYWINQPERYRLVFMAEGVTQPDVSLFLDNPDIVTRYTLFLKAIQDLEGRDLEAEALKTQEGADEARSKLDFILSTLHGIAHNKITMSGYPWSSPEDQIKYAIKGIL